MAETDISSSVAEAFLQVAIRFFSVFVCQGSYCGNWLLPHLWYHLYVTERYNLVQQ